MKRIAIVQPIYLPWLGYFDMMRSVDTFVLYDHVQFARRSWQQRNRIRNARGVVLLTVPVLKRGRREQAICEVEIDRTQHFPEKHIKTIKLSYGRAKSFDSFFPKVEAVYRKGHSLLCDLNEDFIQLGREALGITTPLVRSRDLGVQGNKVEALIDVCRKLEADYYLSSVGAKEYIDENNLFESHGICLEYQNYKHPSYWQMDYPEFVSRLSFIDYLFNQDCGK